MWYRTFCLGALERVCAPCPSLGRASQVTHQLADVRGGWLHLYQVCLGDPRSPGKALSSSTVPCHREKKASRAPVVGLDEQLTEDELRLCPRLVRQCAKGRAGPAPMPGMVGVDGCVWELT